MSVFFEKFYFGVIDDVSEPCSGYVVEPNLFSDEDLYGDGPYKARSVLSLVEKKYWYNVEPECFIHHGPLNAESRMDVCQNRFVIQTLIQDYIRGDRKRRVEFVRRLGYKNIPKIHN